MKKLLVILGVCLLAFAFAGADLFAAQGHGLNPYRTPEFVRNPAQMANTVDPLAIAVYNPAGFTKLQDGFYVGLGNIYILKENEYVTSSKTYKQEEPSPLVPTAAFAWKAGKAVLFANLEVIDGGGKLEYKEFPWMITTPLTAYGEGKLEAESSWKQFKVGVSAELNEMISLTGGVRYIMAETKAKVTVISSSSALVSGVLKDEETKMTGQGGFFGINLTPVKEATINVTYFTKAFVDGEKKDKKAGTKTQNTDIVPSYLTVGVAYAVMPELTVSAGFNYVYTKEEKHGDADSDKNFTNQKNALEVALGADYKANEMLTLSAGWAIKKAGGKSETYQTSGEAANPDLDLQVFGGGAKITAMPGLNINAGIMKAFFKEGKNVAGDTTYKRDAWLFSLGVDYKI